MRGVHREAVTEGACSEWRERSAAMVVDCPDDTLCDEASRKGILVVAWVDATRDTTAADLQRLAQWPSVGMVLLDGIDEPSLIWRHMAPNLLFACRSDLAGGSLPPWAHFMFVESRQLAVEGLAFERFNVPLAAMRKITERRSLVDARLTCDELQRDLALVGDFAGYVV